MQLKMDRFSKDVTIIGLEKGTSVTIELNEETLVQDTNKKGNVIFKMKKFINKFHRKEISITFRKEGQNDIRVIAEVRQTKLLVKQMKEIVKE